MPTYTLNVNGQDQVVTVDDPSMPLLWVIRDLLGLTGTKYGCGIEVCGACSVLADGQVIRSCVEDVSSMVGKKIVTIEGLSTNRSHPAQQAWIANQVPQCGYCQSGMIMCAVGSMNSGNHGSDINGDMQNVCVCGTYQRIQLAVLSL